MKENIFSSASEKLYKYLSCKRRCYENFRVHVNNSIKPGNRDIFITLMVSTLGETFWYFRNTIYLCETTSKDIMCLWNIVINFSVENKCTQNAVPPDNPSHNSYINVT